MTKKEKAAERLRVCRLLQRSVSECFNDPKGYVRRIACEDSCQRVTSIAFERSNKREIIAEMFNAPDVVLRAQILEYVLYTERNLDAPSVLLAKRDLKDAIKRLVDLDDLRVVIRM